MTRDSNSQREWGPCVDERGRAGNRRPADLKVSLHGDGSYAAGAHGFHVIYRYAGSRSLATTVRSRLRRRRSRWPTTSRAVTASTGAATSPR